MSSWISCFLLKLINTDDSCFLIIKMSKKYILVGLIVLALLGGCSGGPYGSNTNNDSSDSSNSFTDISYSNGAYGFSIYFPNKEWFAYTATNRQLDLGELGTAESVDFGLDKADSLFNVAFYTKEQWAAIQAEDGPKPTMLGETDQYVYGYTIAQDDFGMKKRFAEVPAILKTFTLQ